MFDRSTIGVVLGVVYLYNTEIKEGVRAAYKYIKDMFTNKLMISGAGNEKIIYAIREELTAQCHTTSTKFNVTDGVIRPNYKLSNGLSGNIIILFL